MVANEGKGNITLTCKVSDSCSVKSYKFYRNGVEEKNFAKDMLVVNNNRSNDGNYSCAVLKDIQGLSAVSNVISLEFLCKSYHLLLLY